jgi:hypothetical protein
MLHVKFIYYMCVYFGNLVYEWVLFSYFEYINMYGFHTKGIYELIVFFKLQHRHRIQFYIK